MVFLKEYAASVLVTAAHLQKHLLLNLYNSLCIVDLGPKGLTQVDVNGKNKINVTLSSVVGASMTLDFFLSMMRRIQNDFMHNGLNWQIWVEDGDKFVKHEDAKTRRVEPWVQKHKSSDSDAIDRFLDM